MIIAVDFDGTITYKNAYPNVGEINPRAIEVLRKLQVQGHKLCLWTCRDWYNHTINDAIDACKECGLEFDYVNDSPYKTYSRKIIADVYIDDAVLGGITDWDKIEELFDRAKKHE